MASHGGSRNRSGRHADPTSARSDARDVRLKRLDVGGYDGAIPDLALILPDATARETAVWAELWRTPQASQWSVEQWRWRTIAMYARWSVRAEDPEATAATVTAAQRMADQIGLTPAGLRENGWIVVDDDSASNPEQQQRQTAAKGAARINGGGRRMRSA